MTFTDGAPDPRIGEEIIQLFIRLNTEERIAVIIITHDPQIARQCARRTRMREGTLYEEAPRPA